LTAEGLAAATEAGAAARAAWPEGRGALAPRAVVTRAVP
jgi:hypothetical protein